MMTSSSMYNESSPIVPGGQGSLMMDTLALSNPYLEHPIKGRELITQALMDMCNTGRLQFQRVAASM